MQAVTSQAKIKYAIFDFLQKQKKQKLNFFLLFFKFLYQDIYFFPTLESYA